MKTRSASTVSLPEKGLRERHVWVLRLGLLLVLAGMVAGSFYYVPNVGLARAVSEILTIVGGLCVAAGGFLIRARQSNGLPDGARGDEAGSGVLAVFVPAFVFALYLIFSVVFSDVPYFSVTALTGFGLLPFVVMCFACAGRELVRHLGFFVDAALVVYAVAAAWAIIQFLFYADLFFYHAAHPFASANTLAAVLNVGFLLALGRFFMADGVARSWGHGVGVVLIAAGQLATGSSGGMVAILCALPVFFVMAAPSGRLRLLPCFVMGLVIYGAFLWLDRGSNLQVSSLHYSSFHDRSYNERWQIWGGAWALMRDHLWFGGGLGTFSALFPPYRLEGDRSSGLHAHNDFLHMGGEIGFVGVLLYGVVMAWVIWHAATWCARSFCRLNKDGESGDRLEPRSIVAVAMLCSAAGAIVLHGAVDCLLLSNVLVVWLGVLAGFIAAFTDRPLMRLVACLGALRLFEGRRARRCAGVLVFVYGLGLAALVVWGMPVDRAMGRAQDALSAGNAAQFDAAVQKANRHAMGLSAGAYFLSAQWPYSLLVTQAGGIPPEHIAMMRARVEALYDKALSLDPTMAVVWHQRASLAALDGDAAQAEILWRKALSLDPAFLPARIGYADLRRGAGDVAGYDRVMMEGVDMVYWRVDPLPYYERLREVYERANVSGDQAAALQNMIETTQKMRLKSMRIYAILQGK